MIQKSHGTQKIMVCHDKYWCHKFKTHKNLWCHKNHGLPCNHRMEDLRQYIFSTSQ
jgi:hypothetical protein